MPAPERPIARKVGYDTGPTPDYREVNAFGYHPGKKHARQIQNKGLLLLGSLNTYVDAFVL
jgi:hypothetical protein